MTSGWVAQAMKRIADYQRQDVCFLTKLEPGTGVRIVFERSHPLLRRPRATVMCPTGTDVADICVAFRQHFQEDLYSLWWENNGKALVEKGCLHE